MRIQKIHIQNYKSLVDFTLEDVKPFTAFVGPNASGKSNIFEALEFINYLPNFLFKTPDFFNGAESIISFFHNGETYQSIHNDINLFILFSNTIYTSQNLGFNKFNNKMEFSSLTYWPDEVLNSRVIEHLPFDIVNDSIARKNIVDRVIRNGFIYNDDLEQFFDNFTRVFVGKSELDRIPVHNKLYSSGKNLADILGKIFQDESKREDFIEWLRILVPEFKDIVVKQSNIDGSFAFEVIEKSSNKAFPVRLLSDGTRNILTLMAAVYQQEQQFLCIEEPENGLHPQAIELLVDFFREKCEGENGHHIWLNTHSPTLIRCMEIDEVITVNKIDGRTIAKQHHKSDNINIKTDEAWLSNALGGGVSWSK